MSPHTIHEPRPLSRQPQRPSWPVVATTARREAVLAGTW